MGRSYQSNPPGVANDMGLNTGASAYASTSNGGSVGIQATGVVLLVMIAAAIFISKKVL